MEVTCKDFSTLMALDRSVVEKDKPALEGEGTPYHSVEGVQVLEEEDSREYFIVYWMI